MPRQAPTSTPRAARPLDPMVGDRVTHVAATARDDVPLDLGKQVGRHDTGEIGLVYDPMPPADDIAQRIEADFNMLRRQRAELVVHDVVFAAPDHLDRSAGNRLRQKRRLEQFVAVGLAAETAAKKGGVNRHLIGRSAGGSGGENFPVRR